MTALEGERDLFLREQEGRCCWGSSALTYVEDNKSQVKILQQYNLSTFYAGTTGSGFQAFALLSSRGWCEWNRTFSHLAKWLDGSCDLLKLSNMHLSLLKLKSALALPRILQADSLSLKLVERREAEKQRSREGEDDQNAASKSDIAASRPDLSWVYGDLDYSSIEGTFMLLYTVPILLIAVLGCVYLHLTRNARNYSAKTRSNGPIARLRRPMLIRGPLGVVSSMELILFFLFIALIVWIFVHGNVATPVVGNMNARQNSRHANDKMWQKNLRSTAFFMSIAGNFCCSFLFYPVTRGSSILALLGLNAEGSIKYHTWIGHIVMFFFTMHSLMFVVYWAIVNDLKEMLIWDHNSNSNVPGEIAILFGLAIWVTVHPRIRRKMFELFFYTHQLYIPFMFFYMLHTGFYFIFMVFPGFYLFLIDRYLRFLQSRQRVRLVSARILPCETVELNFSKSLALEYTTTSFVSINVPSISSMQWHPFTVSSNSSLEPDRISVIVKRDGSWSRKLVEKLASSSPPDRLEVSMEGPYGPASTDFLRYETLVLVAGGSGIAPMITIIRELIFRKTKVGCPTPRVVLICAFKNSVDLSLLNLILPVTGTSLDITQLDIEIEAFVTREKGPASIEQNNNIKTIWFKTHPSDEPFSAALGSYGWIWLGAIIISSFVMFLIFSGLLGHFYIYPKDKGTNMVYSWTNRAALNALFFCVSIIITATMAVLFNKRRYSQQASRVQSIELANSTGSPSAWLQNPDRELESLPDQSIVERTKVHYGERPNLEKMLLQFEGSSTGVLVCGPAMMRREIASVCASGLVENLHYESISYNS
ncbi:ferric reduction oxidase 2-like [Aristolochia californica]|uniref:ferric reduction oxidase 2-like n=1 Tax=Aristolochia californica TaxID=171875 RepID=UPI0035DA45A9